MAGPISIRECSDLVSHEPSPLLSHEATRQSALISVGVSRVCRLRCLPSRKGTVNKVPERHALSSLSRIPRLLSTCCALPSPSVDLQRSNLKLVCSTSRLCSTSIVHENTRHLIRPAARGRNTPKRRPQYLRRGRGRDQAAVGVSRGASLGPRRHTRVSWLARRQRL